MNCVRWSMGDASLHGMGTSSVPGQCFGCYPCPWTKLLPMSPDRTPWNPNRLEQREGRVDRYGQHAPRVRTALLYGRDNPMDEAVMQVLLRKAVSIHRTLGISVPLPVDGGTLVEALVSSLFQRGPEQLSLFDT